MANGVPDSSTLDLEIEWTWNKQIGFVKSIIQRFFSFFPSLATHPWQLRIRLLGQALGQAMNTYEKSKMLRYKIDNVFEGTVPTASNLPRLSIPDTSEVFWNPNIYTISSNVHTYLLDSRTNALIKWIRLILVIIDFQNLNVLHSSFRLRSKLFLLSKHRCRLLQENFVFCNAKIHIWKYVEPVSSMETCHTLTTYTMKNPG